MMPEVVYRAAQMIFAFKDMRGSVVSNKAIPVNARAAVVSTYLMSKVLCQSATWHALGIAETIKFHGSIMRIYRSLLGCDTPVSKHRNDKQVISELQVYSPLAMPVLIFNET